MLEFFKQLPKHTLALIVISAGIFLIIVTDPPATVCGEQLKAFKTKQEGFLYKGKDDAFREQTRFLQLVDVCIRSNTVGGCYELFQLTRSTLQDIKSFSLECLPKAGGDAAVKDFLNRSLDLLIRLAWGVKPPESINLKLGWLEPTEVALYCQLKDYYQVIYGDGGWSTFREKYLLELPEAQKIGRNEAWGLTILSLDCSRY